MVKQLALSIHNFYGIKLSLLKTESVTAVLQGEDLAEEEIHDLDLFELYFYLNLSPFS